MLHTESAKDKAVREVDGIDDELTPAEAELMEDEFDSLMAAMNADGKRERVEKTGAEQAADVVAVGPDGAETRYQVEDRPKAEFSPAYAGEVVPAKDAFLFAQAMTREPQEYVYHAEVASVNGDPELEYSDKVVSKRPLSVKSVLLDLWKRVPKGFGVGPDMDRARVDFFEKTTPLVAAVKRGDDAAREQLQAIPFPFIRSLYYGSPEDGIVVCSDKKEFDAVTRAGQPAGYFASEDAEEMSFNDAAKDRIYVRRVLGGPASVDEARDPDEKPFFESVEKKPGKESLSVKRLIDELRRVGDKTLPVAVSAGDGADWVRGCGFERMPGSYVRYAFGMTKDDREALNAGQLLRLAADSGDGRVCLMDASGAVRAVEEASADEAGDAVVLSFALGAALDFGNAPSGTECAAEPEEAAGESPSDGQAAYVGDFPEWALDYAVGGDRSDLTPREAAMVDSWKSQVASLGYALEEAEFGGECDFSQDPEFGAPCDCVKFVMPRRA